MRSGTSGGLRGRGGWSGRGVDSPSATTPSRITASERDVGGVPLEDPSQRILYWLRRGRMPSPKRYPEIEKEVAEFQAGRRQPSDPIRGRPVSRPLPRRERPVHSGARGGMIVSERTEEETRALLLGHQAHLSSLRRTCLGQLGPHRQDRGSRGQHPAAHDGGGRLHPGS